MSGSHSFLYCMGFQFITGYPQAFQQVSLTIFGHPLQLLAWRESLWGWRVLPKNTTQLFCQSLKANATFCSQENQILTHCALIIYDQLPSDYLDSLVLHKKY